MGKKNKSKSRFQMQKPDREVRQIFLGEGQEPLTEDLIAELVTGGWPESDVRQAASQGAMYSRPRHSLVYPLEWSSPEFRDRLLGE